MERIIEMQNIKKIYDMGDVKVNALSKVNFSVNNGEFVAIIGHSGSGKSTLMNIIGCLDSATSGNYYLEGKNINDLDKKQYADIRNQRVGFVFQSFNLLARTSALENVELPLFYDRTKKIKDSRKKAVNALKRVDLGDRLYHESNELSGGQRQRVAIARALVNDPAIMLADEPTGSVDSKTSLIIMGLFQELNRQGVTIILVTHEANLMKYAKRIVRMRDGKVVQNATVKNQRDAKQDLKNWQEIEKSDDFLKDI